jgi:hypothetical protein
MYLEPATTPSPGDDTGRDAVMRILMKVDSTSEASKWVALAPMEYSNEAELQSLLMCLGRGGWRSLRILRVESSPR